MRKIHLVLFMILASAACSLKSNAPADDPTADAKAAFEKADKLFTKKYYQQSIEQFERLRNSFPFSKYAVMAELRVADALYSKGDYAEAAEAYRTFTRLHPRHEQLDYATYRVGLSLFKDAPSGIDRDQTNTERALEEFRRFLKDFPESPLAAEATDKMQQGRQRLAEKELYIGRFYYRRENYRASIPRFATVVEKYPDASISREAMLLLAKAYSLDGNDEKASDTLTEFLRRYETKDSLRNEAEQLLNKQRTPSRPTAATDAALTSETK